MTTSCKLLLFVLSLLSLFAVSVVLAVSEELKFRGHWDPRDIVGDVLVLFLCLCFCVLGFAAPFISIGMAIHTRRQEARLSALQEQEREQKRNKREQERNKQKQERNKQWLLEIRSCEKRQAERKRQRHKLATSIVTAKTLHVHGMRTQRQLGAVHSRWHTEQPDTIPRAYFLANCGCRRDLSQEFPLVGHYFTAGDEIDLARPGTHGDADSMTMCELVELTLKYKAHELGANVIVNLRIRSFKNGCEGSGDAVFVADR